MFFLTDVSVLVTLLIVKHFNILHREFIMQSTERQAEIRRLRIVLMKHDIDSFTAFAHAEGFLPATVSMNIDRYWETGLTPTPGSIAEKIIDRLKSYSNGTLKPTSLEKVDSR